MRRARFAAISRISRPREVRFIIACLLLYLFHTIWRATFEGYSPWRLLLDLVFPQVALLGVLLFGAMFLAVMAVLKKLPSLSWIFDEEKALTETGESGPPRPEGLLDAVIKLQKQIAATPVSSLRE